MERKEEAGKENGYLEEAFHRLLQSSLSPCYKRFLISWLAGNVLSIGKKDSSQTNGSISVLIFRILKDLTDRVSSTIRDRVSEVLWYQEIANPSTSSRSDPTEVREEKPEPSTDEIFRTERLFSIFGCNEGISSIDEDIASIDEDV